MGLDMYLDKKYYVKNWDHQTPEEKHKITILLGDKPSIIPTDKIKYIEIEAMYWRKANQIHKWFVDNVQDGKDDCGDYEVSTNQLKELLIIVTSALSNRKNAKTLLPSQTGFFFGGTDYDEYYWSDLQDTKEALEKLIAQDEIEKQAKIWSWFTYHSSW